MAPDFSVLANQSFWLVFISFALLFGAFFLIRNLSEIAFKNTSYKFGFLFILAIVFAFSIALLTPVINLVFKTLIDSGQTSEITLFAYSLIATLLVTYSLNVISNFEKKEKEIVMQITKLRETAVRLQTSEANARERIARLSEVSNSLLETGAQHEKLLKRVELLSELTLSRTSSFSYVVNEVNELPLEIVENNKELRKKYMDLKLLQIAIGRDDIAKLCFDLKELKTIIQSEPGRMQDYLSGTIENYFTNLVEYYKITEADAILLDKLEELVNLIFE